MTTCHAQSFWDGVVFGLVLLLSWVVLSGCGYVTTPARTAKARAEVSPKQTYGILLQLQQHVSLQYARGGMEVEHYNIIIGWIAQGLNVTLTGKRHEDWEAVARPGWPMVRSLLGPYEALQGDASAIDRLLQ